MDANEFRKRMRQIGRDVEENSTKLVRKVALAVDATVVLATPVDTGRARSNWQVEIGKAADGTIDPYAPGEGGNTAGVNAQAAMDQARAKIAQVQHGQEVHITNNLDYIQRLNDGWSAQAPAGFVEEAVNHGVSVVRRAKVVVSKS